MKFQQLESFVFDPKSGVLGAIASIDFINQTISILNDEDEVVVANLADVELLEQIGAIGGVGVINHDVVITAVGMMYEIVLTEDNKVQLYLLNAKLERVEAGDVITKEDLHVLAPYVEVIGNIHELEPAVLVDFNIQIVRDMGGNEFQGYKYACNRPEVEEIDLVNLLFAGHPELEESYERMTITHEQYLTLVENGSLKEVTLDEVLNYITGVEGFLEADVEPTPEPVEPDIEPQIAVDEEAGEDCDCIDCRLARAEKKGEEVCEDCGEPVEECECNDW